MTLDSFLKSVDKVLSKRIVNFPLTCFCFFIASFTSIVLAVGLIAIVQDYFFGSNIFGFDIEYSEEFVRRSILELVAFGLITYIHLRFGFIFYQAYKVRTIKF